MKIKTITFDNFKQEVLHAKKPVLLDFWAEWCLPCRMLFPLIEEVAKELDDKVLVGKINVDQEQALTTLFDIMSIPTLVILSEGEITHRFVGGKSKAELVESLLSTASAPQAIPSV
jgi:thioredoxin 1